MATVYESLSSAWQARITAQYASDSNAVAYHTALADLAAYIAAMQAMASNAATDIASYSRSGISVSRTQSGNVASTVSRLRQRLERYCGSGGAIVDDFSMGTA